MKSNYGKFDKSGKFKLLALAKIIGIMGLTGASLLMTIASQAKEVRNTKPSIFNEPLYNRGKKPSVTTPITKPTQPATEIPPVKPTQPATEIPPVKPTPTTPITEIKETRNLIVLANANGSFKTLIKALTAAGLIDTLQGDGPFTIFAPTDAAFAKLPQDAVRDLLKPENKQILRQVLTYHVVSGKVLSSDLKSGELKSLQGDPISIKVNSNGVEVNDAKITKADIQGSNGVIHQIDNLILPPSI
ncbi:fasciclin domain-containing protein [Dolichospermum circinale]|uniref:fasciclin domain-containing protein n=1 Tax=Dolichospermum circinale TaxID=109265 RepID=UPI00232D5CBD|nr:fasciclin domain-containing protein [Dolichospermum circinale]MDB9457448.1 fasciclin domain-containing protein [Dolichospermum circinale CS-545/17]MDB9466760.1 fasciclin domain-containing protein [Dolichospermum circinale CS-539/09]MDB9472689.1 fasciclin domain-containing protein [Dolichospermum circinale CS-539]